MAKGQNKLSVEEYMSKLEHPLKEEIEALRTIIKNTNKNICERIKWNAPSYYIKDDMLTFNPRNLQQVHIVFHHKEIVKIDSEILEGDYKDRRMVYFKNMTDIKKKKKEFTRIIRDLVELTIN